VGSIVCNWLAFARDDEVWGRGGAVLGVQGGDEDEYEDGAIDNHAFNFLIR